MGWRRSYPWNFRLPHILLQVMYSCLCCEEPTAAFPLTLSDLRTPSRTLLYSSYQIALNPEELKPTAVTCNCKRHASLLDTVTDTPTGRANEGSDGISATMARPVDIGSCQLCCSRCGEELGDGQTRCDDDGENENENENETEESDQSTVRPSPIAPSSETCRGDVGNGELEATKSAPAARAGLDGNAVGFRLDDLRDVRLLRHKIHVTVSNSQGSVPGFPALSTEQVVLVFNRAYHDMITVWERL